MIESCEDKYLRFEAWKKIGEKEILKWGTCWALLGPYPCQIAYHEDIFGWVEVAKELAEKITTLPLYPSCMATVPLYEGAVRVAGGSAYDKNQRIATNHAEALSKNQLNGSCALYTSADNSNLFSNNNTDIAKHIYKNIIGREPTQQEYSAAVSMENSHQDWEYHLVSENVATRNVIALIPVLGLILN